MDARYVGAGSPRFAEGARVARRLILAAIAAIGLMGLGLVVGAAPATAVVPGQNGPIAFSSNRTIGDEIYVMDADGQNQTRLTTNNGQVRQPAFSPDGTKITFASGRDGNYEIYVMDADGQTRPDLTNNEARNGGPRSLPTAARSPSSAAATATTRSTSWTPTARTRPGSPTNAAPATSDPALSPDGTKIAFSEPSRRQLRDLRDGRRRPEQTNLTNQRGAPTTSPTSPPTAPRSPSPAPRRQRCEIYVMDADGQNPTRLTTSRTNTSPACSPDGTKIAFVRYGANGSLSTQIYAMDADGQNPTPLTDEWDEVSDREPDWGVLAFNNQAPTAEAGAVQTVASKASATLNGSGAIPTATRSPTPGPRPRVRA